MPLTGHKIPVINGVIAESNKSIVYYCLLILRQSRLLPAGLMSLISNVEPESINQWAFKNNLIHINIADIKYYEQNKMTNSYLAWFENVLKSAKDY